MRGLLRRPGVVAPDAGAALLALAAQGDADALVALRVDLPAEVVPSLAATLGVPDDPLAVVRACRGLEEAVAGRVAALLAAHGLGPGRAQELLGRPVPGCRGRALVLGPDLLSDDERAAGAAHARGCRSCRDAVG